jgi:hypothetical protein
MMSDEEDLEQYGQAVATITAATDQPFLTSTPGGKMRWSHARAQHHPRHGGRGACVGQLSYRVIPAEYLATLAIVDRVVGWMRRLGIRCEADPAR